MDTSLIDKAIVFAVKAHSNTTRKGGKIPYISHPLEVFSICCTLTSDENVLASSVLHDTIEDTCVTIEDIKREFNEQVAFLVGKETENKRTGVPQSESWKIRKQETIDMLKIADKNEQILVLCDKLSNMRAVYRDYSVLGEEFWQIFNNKNKCDHAWYYKSIAENLTFLKETFAYKEFVELIELVFG